MPSLGRLLLSAVAAGVMLAGSASLGAAGVPIQPHRAIYKLSLKSVGTSGKLVDVTGALYLEFAETCKGWRTKHNMRLSFLRSESVERVTRTDFSSWESKDGHSFTFSSVEWQDGRVFKRYSGRARLYGSGKGGRAVFVQPKRLVVDLPKGTVFPTAHMLEVLARAKAGATRLWRIVFDGSDDRNLYGVNVFIGKAREPEAKAKATPLLYTRGWPLMLAYFPVGGKSAQPDYQLAVRLHNNSVTGDMELDYGRFVLDAKLVKIAPLPRPRC